MTTAKSVIAIINEIEIHSGDNTHHQDQVATKPTLANFKPINKIVRSITKKLQNLLLSYFSFAFIV